MHADGSTEIELSRSILGRPPLCVQDASAEEDVPVVNRAETKRGI